MTDQALELAKNKILMPGELSESALEMHLGKILGPEVDSADLYFQATSSESWVLENGIIKQGSYSIENGVGVRAVSGEKTGFAYTDDINNLAIEQAANAARSITKMGQSKSVSLTQHEMSNRKLYLPDDPNESLSETEKVLLLKEVDAYIRSLDKRVSEVIISISCSHDLVLVVDSDGTYRADARPLVRFNISVVMEEDGRRESGRGGGGGRYEISKFTENSNELAFMHAKEAVRMASVNLTSKPAPAGVMPVVLGPGWPGVLLHEAVGHGLEGDFNRKGTSAFSGRIGERVASPLCTVVDDGTLSERRGSLNMDDEGVESQYTVLIEKGILKGYMQDKLNAKLMKTKPTGNGRRESYQHLPMPRMTNTYMLAGESSPEDIIKSVDKGIYAVDFGGGQVDITSGKFVFNISEAYMIEKGKVTHPIKGATIIGNGPDVLTKVSMVGNDLQLDKGIGTCGKDGQSVPVGVGRPTILVNEMTVGGTEV